jgi:hypothetical protein
MLQVVACLLMGAAGVSGLGVAMAYSQTPLELPPVTRRVQVEDLNSVVVDRHRDRFERHRPIQIEPVELGVLSGRIENDRIRDRFIAAGRSLIQATGALTDKQIVDLIKVRNEPVSIPLPRLASRTMIQYEDIAKASLLLGSIYDCGRCNNIHENVAGGVIISNDGLAVTNYHVLSQEYAGTLAVLGMTCDGIPRPVIDVLYANEVADVALIRLGGAGNFHPVPIAPEIPRPLADVTVLSHPKHNFFVLTTGVVNRHVRLTGKRGPEDWMEVTAEYAAGSSGSGVFDKRGALIGLVSSNTPLPRIMTHRKSGQKHARTEHDTYYEMTLRRCVTVEAIRSCFAEGAKTKLP